MTRNWAGVACAWPSRSHTARSAVTTARRRLCTRPAARPDAPMSAFVDYTDVSSAQKAHSATIIVAGQHLRTNYNFRKNKGDGPRRANRGSFDGNGSYDGEERGGGRSRYDSFDSQPGRKSRYDDEVEDRRHHHLTATRVVTIHRATVQRSEDAVAPLCVITATVAAAACEEARRQRERSRDYAGDRSYGRPDEVEEFQQHERRSQLGYYEECGRCEERVPREYSGRGIHKSTVATVDQRCRLRAMDRVAPRNDRSWSPLPPPSGGPRSRSRSR